MSGPDLRVDYGLLDGSSRRLQQMKSFFDGIQDWDRSCDSAWGSGAIASAMSGSFAGNWNVHRKELVSSMDSLSELCDQAVVQFQNADGTMARKLTGHGG